MRVISNKRLAVFGAAHPDADGPLQIWRKLMEGNQFYSFHDLRRTFGSMDIYEEKYIFDIRGNHYRIVTGISFSQQTCYIRHVLTHAEYNKGKWK